jgi:hypothetical protein
VYVNVRPRKYLLTSYAMHCAASHKVNPLLCNHTMPQLLSCSIRLITLFIYTAVLLVCINGFIGCQHHRRCSASFYSASSMQMVVEDATLLTRSEAIMYPLGFLAAFRTGAAISVKNQPQIPPVDVAVGSTVLSTQQLWYTSSIILSDYFCSKQ